MRVHSFYVLGPDPALAWAKREGPFVAIGNMPVPNPSTPWIALGTIALVVAASAAKAWSGFRAKKEREKFLWRCEFCFKETVSSELGVAAMTAPEAHCGSGRKVGLFERLRSGLFGPRYDCRSAIDRDGLPKWMSDIKK